MMPSLWLPARPHRVTRMGPTGLYADRQLQRSLTQLYADRQLQRSLTQRPFIAEPVRMPCVLKERPLIAEPVRMPCVL
jgi:hypothetical protein